MKNNDTSRRLARRLFLVMILLFLCCSATCEVDTTISVNDNVPPTFSFSGSGFMTFFYITEVAVESQNVPASRQDGDKNTVIWQIWPNQPLDKTMDRIPSIIYGQIPQGWHQTRPKDGDPPRLVEGKVYEAGCPAASAGAGRIRFLIRDGKAIEVPIQY